MEVIDEQGQALSETNALASRDSANWDVASTEGNIASYVHYLEKEPNGAFRKQAQQAITILEKKDQQKVAEEKEREKQKKETYKQPVNASRAEHSKPSPDRPNATITTKSINDTEVSEDMMRQYNRDVTWARNMINSSGCVACKRNNTCKQQVLEKLKRALQNNPNGVEAIDLMQCLTN